jgi:hypothetical protein
MFLKREIHHFSIAPVEAPCSLHEPIARAVSRDQPSQDDGLPSAAMKTKPACSARAWSDPDNAPKPTKSFFASCFARAEIRQGDKVLRPARGVLPPKGRKATLSLDPDVVEALRATRRRELPPGL